MTDQELTPWFMNGEKPARDGVYEVELGFAKHVRWYSSWSAGRWHWLANEIHNAFDNRELSTSAHVERWRGIASAPKAKP